jgi:flagellar protein FliO/FliZ
MVISTDQLFDLRTLLLVGVAIAVIVVAAVLALAHGRPAERRMRAENPTQKRRLAIVESLDLDPHRRLVILRRDFVEHLVLIGGPSDLVVETDITLPVDMRAGLPVSRAVRTEPEDLPRERPVPAFDEETELGRSPVLPRPARGVDFTEGYKASREPPSLEVPPIRAPFPAPGVPPAGQVRAASPLPPRRSSPPPQPTPGRSLYRGAVLPRTTVNPAADTTREDAASASRRSLATPVLRSTPPSHGPVDEARDQAAGTQSRHEDPHVPTQVEPVVAEMPPPQDTGPETDAVQADSDETADVLREPEASAEGSNSRAPIDRLEAEIARLLGRAPTG